MKKIFTYSIFILVCSALTSGFAQSLTIPAKTSLGKAETATRPHSRQNANYQPLHVPSKNNHQNAKGNQVQTLFDSQFYYDLGLTGMGGVAFTGTEFWVSHWNQDSIYTYSPLGVRTAGFKITGVGNSGSGIRAMTYNGTNGYIYAGINTTSIQIINPATKTRVGAITSQAPFGVRSITYDSLANGGAGGFWVSNFSTAFYLISMTGAKLDSIPMSKHGMVGVYGLALDRYTSGGPYLWAFDQQYSTEALLVRVPIATGIPTCVMHNTQRDIASTTAISGGLFITDRYAPFKKTIMGLLQTDNAVFGYELNSLPAVDASTDSLLPSPGFTQVPGFERSALSWKVNTLNMGQNAITSLSTTVEVFDSNFASVYAPASMPNANIATCARVEPTIGTYAPPANPMPYFVQSSVVTDLQSDLVGANDTLIYLMFITDSTMARDQNNLNSLIGLLGANAGGGGTLGNTFTLPYPAYLTSVTYISYAPTAGDSTNASISTFDPVNGPGNILYNTTTHIFTAGDASNGVVLDLPIVGGPKYVAAGTYFVGANEYNEDLTLGADKEFFQYEPQTAWVYDNFYTQWFAIEDYFSKLYPIVRLNMQAAVNVTQVEKEKFAIYPNPAASELTIESYQTAPNYKVELFDVLGAKVMEVTHAVASKTTMDVSALSQGIYFVKTTVGDKSTTTRVSITR